MLLILPCGNVKISDKPKMTENEYSSVFTFLEILAKGVLKHIDSMRRLRFNLINSW